MLIALLSPLFGILGSLLPSIVRIFERKQELNYEIQLNKLKMEAAEKNANLQIAIENVKADIADANSVRSYDSNIDGGRFVNALRTSLRPVITYVFFFTFIAIKLIVLFVMIEQNASMLDLVKAVWDQDTMALFGAIMGFWFGSRILEKAGYGGMTYGRLVTTSAPQDQSEPPKSKQTK